MARFNRDEFWGKVLSMYNTAKESNYVLKLDPEQVNELKAIYIDLYIPMEKLSHYDEQQILKKMMTAMVSINTLDKDAMSNTSEVVQLVNTVQYDGKSMYVKFARISPVMMRRFELGMSRQQIAEKMGYSVTTVKNMETSYCDLTRQPEQLVYRLAKALECEPEALY